GLPPAVPREEPLGLLRQRRDGRELSSGARHGHGLTHGSLYQAAEGASGTDDPYRPPPRPRDHLSAMGVIIVVTMTMMTTAEKRASSMTRSLFPALAKIRPPSPRGPMPRPTDTLSILPATSPQSALPTTAATVSAADIASVPGRAKVERLTCMPIS